MRKRDDYVLLVTETQRASEQWLNRALDAVERRYGTRALRLAGASVALSGAVWLLFDIW